ncbi:hypothetical protein REC12_19280 [Desulfosporosinus sp. PR]|uniref:hypothetical protein n=1 Tax=Candidatus Desulfosporosinus nitrosoreducens TaxID=3401928 RepID=UPI0027F03571|nr:hypothetical protein [Desulfosporosinus sp. PR]MDQ7095737.1 hypothetical protein [Desulfosporosinus sp. PR]
MYRNAAAIINVIIAAAFNIPETKKAILIKAKGVLQKGGGFGVGVSCPKVLE